MNKEKSHATLTIHRASDMSPQGRKDIAAWLRECAKSLIKDGKNYSKKFTAKYL